MDLDSAQHFYSQTPDVSNLDQQSVEDDWYSYLSNPVITLGAGMVCGVLVNLFSRGGGASRAALTRMNSEELTRGLFTGPHKMVLCIRTDLGMQKGKVAAQCAHAALGCYKKAVKNNSPALQAWEKTGQTKICLKVENEEALLNLAGVAKVHGLTWCIVRDAGKTQVSSGTMTVIGIGPASAEDVDKLTGHLKLY